MLFFLRRTRLNRGGYDSSGSYFGLGAPVFAFESLGGAHCGTCRAHNRDAAKAYIHLYIDASARFYR